MFDDDDDDFPPLVSEDVEVKCPYCGSDNVDLHIEQSEIWVCLHCKRTFV